MKKIAILLLVLITVALSSTSCESISDAVSNITGVDLGGIIGSHTEHSFEYDVYDSGHFKRYTCGCPSPEIIVMHYDYDDDELCDACGHAHEHIFGEWDYDEYYHWCSFDCTFDCCDIDTADSHRDSDGDGVCDICGYARKDMHIHTETRRYNDDGHWWIYTCGCDSQIVVDAHFDTDSDSRCDVCSYYLSEIVQLGTVETWLNDITADDLVSVCTTRSGMFTELRYGIEEIFTVTDKADLGDIIERYKTFEMETLDPLICYEISDAHFSVTFNFVTGESKTIKAQGGFIYKEYDISNAPRINYYESAMLSYSFVRYLSAGEVWVDDGDSDPYYLCDIDLTRLEFVPLEYEIGMGTTDYPYLVKTSEDTLGFISSDIFFVVGEGRYFRLIGDDLDTIVASALSADYSLVMNGDKWLAEPLKATYKEGETVTVRINMAYDVGYLFLVNGEDIAECRDVDSLYWEFTFTMPARNTVIDFKTYDGFLPDANYAVIIKNFWLNYPDAEYVTVDSYYGEYDSGAIVAVVLDGDYPEVILEETVGGFDFYYSNPGYRIRVLYDGKFMALPEAYSLGLLTYEDMASINMMHRELYPYLY